MRNPGPALASHDTSNELIAAAERLFAQHGIQAVSNRQIAAAAHCGNTNGVQYHFGSKEGLIRAIFEYRLPTLESLRSDQLKKLNEAGKMGDPFSLFCALARPIINIVDDQGGHIWAAFLNSIYRFDGSFEVGRGANDLSPMMNFMVSLLRSSQNHLPDAIFAERLHIASSLFVTSFVDAERRGAIGNEAAKEILAGDYMTMAFAALTAPLYPGRAELTDPQEKTRP